MLARGPCRVTSTPTANFNPDLVPNPNPPSERSCILALGSLHLLSAPSPTEALNVTPTCNANPNSNPQLAILREADLYSHWGPFMDRSAVVKDIGKCELVVNFNIHVPLIADR